MEAINDMRARMGLRPIREGELDSRAVSKLNHADRCEALAFSLCKVPNEIVAIVFDVHERTIIRIKSPSFKHYPNTKAELMQYDTNWEFCNKWITEKREAAIKEIYPQFQRLPKP